MKKIIICSYSDKLLPVKTTSWSICWDIKVAKNISVKSSEVKLLPTWIKTALPIWWWIKFYARSSSPIKRWYTLANCTAIIDPDYRWESFIQVINLSSNTIQFEKGERIAQMEIFPYYVDNWIFWTKNIPEIELIVDKEIFEKFADIYPTWRWSWWFGSTWYK